jgi:hypothetical protein
MKKPIRGHRLSPKATGLNVRARAASRTPFFIVPWRPVTALQNHSASQ